jgi:hypothetical protein
MIKKTIIYRRDWKQYSKDYLVTKLSTKDWKIMDDTVLRYWNSFENNLINAVHMIILVHNLMVGSHGRENLSHSIKSKLNLRKRLLLRFR